MTARSSVRWLERTLWIAGFVLLAWVGYVWADGRLYQARAEAQLEEAIAEAQAAESEDERPAPRGGREEALPAELPGDDGGTTDGRADEHPAGAGGQDVVGKLEIPRLGLTVMVSQGTSARVLRRGAGHLTSTPLPGAHGNSAIAGHRDRHFRPLENVNPGDDLIFTGVDGTYRYRVEWTEIVWPDETRVLAPTEEPSITLVTCYPFYYVGNAPQRFIVRAKQIGSEPIEALGG